MYVSPAEQVIERPVSRNLSIDTAADDSFHGWIGGENCYIGHPDPRPTSWLSCRSSRHFRTPTISKWICAFWYLNSTAREMMKSELALILLPPVPQTILLVIEPSEWVWIKFSKFSRGREFWSFQPSEAFWIFNFFFSSDQCSPTETLRIRFQFSKFEYWYRISACMAEEESSDRRHWQAKRPGVLAPGVGIRS